MLGVPTPPSLPYVSVLRGVEGKFIQLFSNIMFPNFQIFIDETKSV